MRYLLDILSDDKDNISLDVQEIIDDFSNSLYVSSLSIIELVFLLQNGKIKTKYKDPEILIRSINEDFYIETLHTKDSHLKFYCSLQKVGNHKDQIDHFIISQAICEGMPLVSSDRKFREYTSQKLDFIFNKR